MDEKEEKFVAPDFISPIIGWRFWKIALEAPKEKEFQDLFLVRYFYWLQSVSETMFWPPKKRLDAICLKIMKRHRASPGENCECGIYAFRTIEDALDSRNDAPDRVLRGTILGKVKLWGEIECHKLGYRAQYAYPLSLMMGICQECYQPFFLQSESFALKRRKEGKKSLAVVCQNCFPKNIDSEYAILLRSFLDNYGIEMERPSIILSNGSA